MSISKRFSRRFSHLIPGQVVLVRQTAHTAEASLCFLYHEVTGSVTTPLEGDTNSSQDTQHKVTRSIATPPWMGC